MRGAVCFPARRRRESNPEARRRRSARGRSSAIDARRAKGRGRSRSVRRVVSRASRRALPRLEERQTGLLLPAAAIRKSRPRSAKGALSLADAEPSIDESNRPIKNHSHLHETRRSARNLRKARQSRGGRLRVERAGPTHASASDVSARSRPRERVRISPSGRASAPSRRSPPARLTPPPPAKWYIRRGKRTTQRPCGPRRSRCCARRPCSSARPAARCAPRVSVPPRAFPATVPRRDALAMDTPRRAVCADVSAKKPAASSFLPRVFLFPPPRRVRSTRLTRPPRLPPTLRRRRRRLVTSTPRARRRPSSRFRSAYETYRRRRCANPPG